MPRTAPALRTTTRRGLREGPARGRIVAAGLTAVAALLVGAPPAAADPPAPTDHRSTILEVSPEPDGVEVQVVGGDAFLEVQVARGHEVTVAGYSEEPYLRVDADGTVERNRRSPATYLNDDREGAVDLPPEADPSAEPEWEEVAGDGTYAWHDHRIHWMGASPPPGAEPGQVIQEWTVDLTVDGAPVAVQGELVVAEGISPLPWFGLALAGAALVVALGRRRASPVAAVAVLAAAVAATAVGWAQYTAAPADSGVNPLLVVVPLVGVVAAAAGLVLRRRALGPTATLAAAAAVIGWAVLRASVLWKPVLPTDAPFALDRGVTALALGLSIAAAGVLAWSGGLTGIATASSAGAPQRSPGADAPPSDDRTPDDDPPTGDRPPSGDAAAPAPSAD